MSGDEVDRLSREIRESEGRLREAIGQLRGSLDTHLNDEYAHQRSMAPWFKWRDGVNRWRWVTVGGIAVLTVLFSAFVTAFAGALALHIIH